MGTTRNAHVLPAAAAAGVPPSASLALLLRARAGDEAARNELCARYLPRLRRWAHGRLPVWAREHLDTEDIVQDALMKSVRRLETFAPEHEGAFCAYVCEALRNRLRDAMRRAIRRPPGQELSVEEPALYSVAARACRRTAAALPLRCGAAAAARVGSRAGHRSGRARARLPGHRQSVRPPVGSRRPHRHQPRPRSSRRRDGA